MDVGLLIIHVTLGSLLAAHGAQKLFGVFGGHGLEGTGAYLEGFGLRPGKAFALLAGSTELVGGVLFAIGLFVPGAAALIVGTMIVAARTDHRMKGLWVFNGGSEYVLTIAAIAAALAFNGAGDWSVDNAIGWDVSGVAWGVGALVVGAVGAAGVLGLAASRRVDATVSSDEVSATA